MPEIGVNKIIPIGRTGADTELKYTSNGKAVANFSLAINESFNLLLGESNERELAANTLWHHELACPQIGHLPGCAFPRN